MCLLRLRLSQDEGEQCRLGYLMELQIWLPQGKNNISTQVLLPMKARLDQRDVLAKGMNKEAREVIQCAPAKFTAIFALPFS